MKIKGGILLLFSLVVTIVALGILFLLSSTSIANLRAVSVDNSGSQLIQNIQSGKIFMENDALPEFDENDQVFIFNGWTFSSDPSLTPFDHAIYDLQLLSCNA